MTPKWQTNSQYRQSDKLDQIFFVNIKGNDLKCLIQAQQAVLNDSCMAQFNVEGTEMLTLTI